MKRLTMFNKTALRLFALLLCLAATVPQLHADVTIFVRGTAPYIYVFDTSGTAPTDGSTNWPGVKMTNSTTSQDGTTWYYVNYEGLNSCSIIFNNGSGGNNNQTWDITGVTGTQYFYSNGSNYYLNLTSVKDKTSYAFFENTNNWSGNLYAHCWNGTYSTNWNGDQMTFVRGTNGGRSVYAWSTNAGTPGMIIFNNGSSQTGDLTFHNGYYYSNNGNSTNTNYVNLSFPTLPTPVTPHYYITGDNGLGLGGFTCVPTLELTDSDEDGIYTYTSTASADGTYNFVFANGQGANSNDWTNFNNNYRIGPTNGNVAVTLNGAFQSTQLAGGDHGAYQVTVAAGTVTFSFKPADMEFKVEGTAPVITYDYYVVGNIFPNGWNTGASTLMTDNNDGTYTWTSGEVHLDTGTYYEYKVLDSNGTYHPSGANATFSAAAPGTYTVTVTYDSNTGTVDAILNTVQLDPTYNYTFYILPSDGTTTPTLYLWGTNNNSYHPIGDWPGTTLNTTEQLADNNNWYKYTGALYANLMNAIVNNGGNGHQTSNITNLAPNTYYIYWNVSSDTYTITTDAPVPTPTYDYTIYVRYKGDDTPYMYMWDGANTELLGAFPGTDVTTFTSEQINGYTYYKYVVTASNYASLNMILNEGDGNHQTANLGVASGTHYYTYGGGNIINGPNDQADPAITYYAESSFYGWTTEGTQMTSDGNGGFTKTFTGVNLTGYTTYEYKVYGNDGTNEGVWYGDANGNNKSFAPEITGTYDVTITLDSEGNISHSLTLTQPGTIYITGDGVLGGFSSDQGIAMTAAGNGVYTYTTTLSDKATTRFIFSDGQDADWSVFNNNYRIAPSNGDENYIVNSGYTTTQKARGDNGSYSVTAGVGTLTFYFDAVNMQYKVEGTIPPIIYYVVGNDADLFGAEWTQNNAGRMTYDSQTATYTWTISNVHLTRGGDYRFKVNGDDNSWYPGYGEDNISIAVGQNGAYDLTITFDGQNVDYTLTPIDLDPFYIQGASELGLSWNYAPTTEMTYDASTGYYTYTCTVENAGTYNFVFGFGQGTDWDDYNNNYSVGPNGATDQSIMPNDEWNSTQMAAGSNKAYSITVNPGTVTFTFDPVNMRFKVNGESLTHRYTFYVLPSDHTTAPYIYLWGLGTDESYTNAYPGNQLTQTEQLADGNTWYKLTVDLTAPYIHALVNGGGDGSKTQDITHIDPGTYYIYWSTTREPGDTVNAYILTTVPPSDSGAPFYIHGTYYLDGTQYHYSSSDGTQMKYDANTHTYYLNNVYLASDNTFCFSTELGNDWQNVGTRYGNGGPDYHTGEGTTNYFAVNSDWINKNLSLNIWSETYGEFKMFEPGIYNILANPEQNWVKLIKTDHSTLTPMNVYLEQTPNVVMSEDFVQIPGTEYTTDIFGNGNWPLAAYNGTQGDWNPHDNGNAYHVTYMGDTITADGKSWWHWQVKASIAELFFTRQNKEPYQSDIIRRKAGVLWITWDEVDGQSTLTDHSREYFDAAANALPTNAVVMEGHYYVYFINTVGWENVYCYAWDNNEMVDDQGNPYIDNTFYDGYSRKMNKWPGQPCELVGIDPVTGYEVWRYDFGTIIGTDIPNGGILFNDGNEYGETEDKEQTGDFEFINGAVYDYLGMVDGDFTLNNLIRKGSLDVRYTISNDLLGVYYDADAVTRITYLDERQQEQHEDIIGALYAKDLNLYGEKSIMPDDSYTDYVYDICSSDHTPGRSQIMIKKTTYDQSNWVKLVVSPNYDGRGAVVPQNERPDLSQYVGHIIPAGTLDVFMTDTINPEAHVLSIQKGGEMNYEPNVYISSHFNDTVVFNFTHQDWLGPDAQYKPNYSCQPQITWNYNEEGEVTGGVATRHPDKNHPYYMYYVAPKPQELAYITWVVYDNDNSDEIWPGYTHGEYNAVTGEGRGEEYPVDPGRFYAPMNWNRSIYLDAEAYPSLSQLTEATQIEKALGAWSPEYGPYSNGYMQYGGIKINWSLFDSDACGKPWWQIIKPGQAYKILAIVRYARGSGEDNSANNYCYGPSNGYIDDNILDGSDDSAPGAVHNAPRRVVDNSTGFANMYFTDYDYLDESKFIIFPIMASSEESNGSGLGNVTTVKEVKTATSREVVAVRYYNLMGVESNKPFDGINIVVTTYSDGSRSSKKILR